MLKQLLINQNKKKMNISSKFLGKKLGLAVFHQKHTCSLQCRRYFGAER